MAKKGKQSKSLENTLQNFNPQIGHNYVNRFLCLPVFDMSGKKLGTVELPEYMVDGKTKDELEGIAISEYRKFRLIQGMIDYKKMRKPESINRIIDGVVDMTTILVAANIFDIYMRRALLEETTDTFVIEIDDEPEIIPVSEEETDLAFINGALTICRKKIEPGLKQVCSQKNYALEATTYIWINSLALVLYDIESEEGVNDIFSLSQAQLDILFDKYYRKNFAEHFVASLSRFSQSMARIILDEINPINETIQTLRGLLGIYPKYELSKTSLIHVIQNSLKSKKAPSEVTVRKDKLHIVIDAAEAEELVLLALGKLKGRPQGVGKFRSNEEFLIALEWVLSTTTTKPSQAMILHKLSLHPLWQSDRLLLGECQSMTKTLRNRLKAVNLTWDKALQLFYYKNSGN
jgi:hypothetical protein